MQFGDREKKLLGYLVLVIGILVASYFGAYNGVPPLPPIPEQYGSQSVPTQPGPPGDFVSMGQGGTFGDAIAVSVPTANATADTGLVVNNLSVAQPFSMQDAGTPVLEGYNGGGVKAYAPTAVATGVPALVVDSAGVSNLFEVRKNATPQVYVDASGNLYAEGIAFSGPTTFGTATYIANNGTIAHGLGTTPTMAIVIPLTTTATITNTPYIKSLDATNITVVVPSGAVSTFDKLLWIAGR